MSPWRARAGPDRHAGGGRRAGFTLIEILAVVAILALVMALVVPNMSGMRGRALASEAREIASKLELARQRAIVTGVPHRLWMDLDEAEYRLEWLVEPEHEVVEIDIRGNTPLDLAAPRGREASYQPIPGNFGRLEVVRYPFYFEALQTPAGRVEKGESHVTFARDGSADYTEIYIEDASGHRVALDVYPLDERVRIRDEF